MVAAGMKRDTQVPTLEELRRNYPWCWVACLEFARRVCCERHALLVLLAQRRLHQVEGILRAAPELAPALGVGGELIVGCKMAVERSDETE
jgi:hypothetical protein